MVVRFTTTTRLYHAIKGNNWSFYSYTWNMVGMFLILRCAVEWTIYTLLSTKQESNKVIYFGKCTFLL